MFPTTPMSTHLEILSQAGLVSSQRQSRSIEYIAWNRLQSAVFMVYLLKDCCAGRPELCQPLLDDLTPCCQPTGASCA